MYQYYHFPLFFKFNFLPVMLRVIMANLFFDIGRYLSMYISNSNINRQHTPPIAEILFVKNGRAIVVCGFLMK